MIHYIRALLVNKTYNTKVKMSAHRGVQWERFANKTYSIVRADSNYLSDRVARFVRSAHRSPRERLVVLNVA